MNRMATPVSARSVRRRRTIWRCVDTSSAETASSQMISDGLLASARAIATRWRWPPENSAG